MTGAWEIYSVPFSLKPQAQTNGINRGVVTILIGSVYGQHASGMSMK